MNKKYIDFVPTNPKIGSSRPNTVKKLLKKPVEAKVAKEEVEEKIEQVEIAAGTGNETFSLKKEPVYGVVEDFRPKFVKTEVTKRPLSSQSHFVKKQDELKKAKAEKVSAKKIEKPVEKPVENSKKTEKEKEDKTKMKIPKSPFINQAKVAKRPLSKNVYERTIKPTEEIPTGPVTIISKPEKDAKISLVVTIILTIILGAAAGTIAFLLLPK